MESIRPYDVCNINNNKHYSKPLVDITNQNSARELKENIETESLKSSSVKNILCDYEDYFNPSWFQDEIFQKQKFHYCLTKGCNEDLLDGVSCGGVTIELCGLPWDEVVGSGAGYNRIGHTLWAAGDSLARYLVENSEVLSGGKRIIELGCGLGLTGLVACKICDDPSLVLLTDGDSGIMDALQQNIDINFPFFQLDLKDPMTKSVTSVSGTDIETCATKTSSMDFECSCLKLENYQDNVDTFANDFSVSHNHFSQSQSAITACDNTCSSSMCITCEHGRPDCDVLFWGENVPEFVTAHGKFDLILGADVLYSTASLRPLVETACELLAPSGESRMIVAFQPKYGGKHRDEFLSIATECGLVSSKIEWEAKNGLKLLNGENEEIHSVEIWEFRFLSFTPAL